MALVLVATAGASTANTYVTLADAETLVLEFLNTSTWTAASDATKNAALVQATHEIDCLPLLGTPEGTPFDSSASDYQPLHFPIYDEFDRDAVTGYIPDAVKRATVAQALYLIRNGAAVQATQDIMASGIKQQSIGHMSQTFDRYAGGVCPDARKYLKKWLTTSRKIEFA